MNRLPCPSCGQQAGVPIIWGMPTPEDFGKVESGQWDVVLGGCCLPDPMVTAECQACDARWLHDDAAQLAES